MLLQSDVGRLFLVLDPFPHVPEGNLVYRMFGAISTSDVHSSLLIVHTLLESRIRQAKAAGLSKPSVLEAKRDPRRYAEQKFQQDALVGEKKRGVISHRCRRLLPFVFVFFSLVLRLGSRGAGEAELDNRSYYLNAAEPLCG